MSLKLKLSLMLSAFLVLILIFSLGVFIIFDRLALNAGELYSVSRVHGITSNVQDQIYGYRDLANKWVLSGDSSYKEAMEKKAGEAYEGARRLSASAANSRALEVFEKEFGRAVEAAALMQKRGAAPAETAKTLAEINLAAGKAAESIDAIQDISVTKVLDVATGSEEVRRKMMYYLVGLIFFSSLASVYLFARIKKMMTEPFGELLKAAEIVGGGDLSYRIPVIRNDEFGLLSSRFNGMAEELESSNRQISRKLSDTELFLDIARIGGATLELSDSLEMTAETISAALGADDCSIFILKPETRRFCVEASSANQSWKKDFCLPLEEGIAGEITATLKPLAIGNLRKGDFSRLKFAEKYASVLAVPVIRAGVCSGLVTISKKEPCEFTEDEIDALRIAAHAIGSAARNAELYQDQKKQLDKLTVLYELSRALTSILDMNELLGNIAREISRLLSARGCIIRLTEDGRLRIRAHYGIPDSALENSDLQLGEGIAGWVAANNSPLLVDDVEKMPPNMRVPNLQARSVICVPLRVGESVTGTLSLYDKVDPAGNLSVFDIDDLNTVEGFALISAIAIDKSNRYENEVRRERKASEEKQRLNTLFDSVQGGLITLDRNFTVLSANRYVEEWTGLSGDELIGKSSLDIFHDRIGICPHCAAKATFETGDINTIMQSRGVNYAELTAYPIQDETGATNECVVFILDITERVLYQEETLSLYREVIQTKEYLEGIIGNSADAIVTSNLDGLITSWNQGAEKIFGFAEEEAIGKFLPFVPDFLLDNEKENMERIRRGETLKDIETLRKRKDGSIIEVSLSLSPVKDAAGEIIGISGISRDISEKKNVEKELIRRNQELSRLFFISSTMRGTLELDRLLRMVLIAVTMSDGMGFNRAILFLLDEKKNSLKGAMGVGPATPEEAWKVWDELSLQKKGLDDIMQEVMSGPLQKDTFLDRLSMGIEIQVEDDSVLTRAVRNKTPYNVSNVKEEPLSDAVLIQQLGTQAYAVVPLISRDRVIGVIWVDNYFNRKPITDEDMKFLASFSNQVASAIENAHLFEQVRMTEKQLENIFESISDMVYFNSRDYEIKSVNRAVCKRLGMEPSEIIGKKCYEVFHGTNEPYKKCPHHKTVTTRRAYVEELEDPKMGGTFLTSSSPIFDMNGEFIGSVHVVRDITELKDLQERVITSEKMAALGEVAAKVAHEIRNPLVSVGGFAKRLEKKLDGNLKEYAGIIVREVERLEIILKEILGFVKEKRLVREPVSLNSLLDDIITLIEFDTFERGIQVVKEFGPAVEVDVDLNRIQEALMNIVTNALQSITGSGSLGFRTYVKPGWAVAEIEDTGKGIPEGDRPFIFNPFFTTKSAGTGLGLAITHKIIQEHGGKIEMESTVGKGSKFRIYIPLKEEVDEDTGG